MGIYAFSPRALDLIEPASELDFPDLVLRLLDAGELVRASAHRRLLARHRSPRRLRAGDRTSSSGCGTACSRTRAGSEARGPRHRLRRLRRLGRPSCWTNQHHLMARLARRNRVLFVESLGLRRPQLAGARPAAHRAAPAARACAGRGAADGVHVLSPLVLPLHGSGARARAQRAAAAARSGRAARRAGSACARPILWAYVPQAEVLLDALDPSLVVYHCVDDIAAQKGVDADALPGRRGALRRPRRPRARERAAARRADAHALRPRARRAERRRHRAVRDGARARRRSTPRSTRCRARASSSQGAVVATKLDLALLGGAGPRRGPTGAFALVGPGRAGDPRTDVSPLDARAERPPARGRAAVRRAAGGAARRRRRPDPLRDQRAHRAASSR